MSSLGKVLLVSSSYVNGMFVILFYLACQVIFIFFLLSLILHNMLSEIYISILYTHTHTHTYTHTHVYIYVSIGGVKMGTATQVQMPDETV